MVDALRRSSRWVKPPLGCIIDLRPADVVPDVEFGLPDGSITRVGGLVVDQERRARHAAADAALREVVRRGDLVVLDEEQFWFFRYPVSAGELREYIATKWQHTHLDDHTYARASDIQRANPNARLWLRERVGIRSLRPSSS